MDKGILESTITSLLASGKITKAEEQAERYRIEALLLKPVSTEYKEQSNLINSKDMSDNMFCMKLDLLKAFKSVDEMSKTVIKHKKINEGAMLNLQLSAKKANDTIDEVLSKRRSNLDSGFVKENFRDSESLEQNVLYYKDRDGESLVSEALCEFNKNNEHITLPIAIQNNMAVTRDDVSFATAKLTMQLGSDLKIKFGALDAMLDNSFATNWFEVIQTNEPMKVDVGDEYGGIKFGAVCEIEITFESASAINEISLNPHYIYPFELISISTAETASLEETFVKIEDVNPGTVLNGPMSVRFKSRICKRIRVLINQINYSSSCNYYDLDLCKKSALFDEAKLIQYGAKDGEINPAMYERVKVQNKAWALLSVASERPLNVEDVLGTTGEKIAINKFNYSYGFNHVGLYFNEFAKTGVYVSKPFSFTKPIWKVALEVNEAHPTVDNEIYTDIEYYISTDDDGADSGWVPIFPKGKKVVDSELLHFENGKTSLRFDADVSSVVIKENNTTLLPVFDYKFTNNQIELIKPIKNAIYTASYEPAEVSKMITLPIIPVQAKERISLKSAIMCKLSNTAIDGQANIVFTDENGTRYSEIECVTNQKSPEQSFTNFNSNKLQFYIVDDVVYFNKELSGVIEIGYEKMNRNLRLKAIFRKNTDNHPWLTPVLDSYKLNVLSV